ncbi:SARP family transcriptional regulator [Rhizocola hellebori]|uniref:SARP family transcriptional regulator n=1 Tax=Rhizocola hellebori TaxID=1392758 RepID=A0A8J3VI26_9ACTN|nr:SARP family transcriptional regulator [Rhizocola hellebori]
MLAYLLLSANQPVSIERLIDALWREAPPATARDQIHAEVSALRKVIRQAGGVDLIESSAAGYRITLQPGQLDLDEFTRAVAYARALAAKEEFGAGAHQLRGALQLWRGEALADVAGEYVAPLRARLEEQRVTAQEYLAELELACGNHDEILGWLADLVSDHPLREGLRAHLMLALYRSGRRSEALSTARELRQLLKEDEGLDPGPDILALERRMLRDEADLVAQPRPRALRQLPADIGDFLGRNEELARLITVLSGHRAVPVTACVAGMGGAGKTTLAVRAAHRLSAGYPDGCLFFDLRGSDAVPHSDFQVMGSILRSLGLPGAAIPGDRDARLAVYRSELADRRLLLVLDNAADEAQIRALVPPSPTSGLLVTSRRVLAGLDGAHVVQVGVLAPGEAVSMLCAMVGNARVDADPVAAARLVELGGRLPLAIRVIGTRLAQRPDLPLARLADRLADERSRLDELAVGDREIRAVIGLSSARLDEDARKAWRRMGLLPVPQMALWTVAALLDLPEAAAERVVDRLVAASLVSPVGGAGETRFALHDLVRLHAREQAVDDEDTASLHRAYEMLLALAVRADAGLPIRAFPTPTIEAGAGAASPAEPVSWFEAEQATILAAVRDCVARQWIGLAWRLVAAMMNFCSLQDYIEEWVDAAELVRSAGGENEQGQAALALGLGGVLRGRGRAAEALPLLRMARLGYRRLGDRRRAGSAALQLSAVHRTGGRWRMSRAAVFWAIRELESIEQTAQLGYAQLALGNLLLETEATEPARLAYQRALEVMRATADRAGEGTVLICLAQTWRRDRRFEKALTIYEEASVICHEVGDPVGRCMAADSIARVHMMTGDLTLATQHAKAALVIAEHSSHPRGVMNALITAGEVAMQVGDLLEAIEGLSRALQLAQGFNAKMDIAHITFQLARARHAAGEPDRARAIGQEALDLYTALNRSETTKVAAWLAATAPPGN